MRAEPAAVLDVDLTCAWRQAVLVRRWATQAYPSALTETRRGAQQERGPQAAQTSRVIGYRGKKAEGSNRDARHRCPLHVKQRLCTGQTDLVSLKNKTTGLLVETYGGTVKDTNDRTLSRLHNHTPLCAKASTTTAARAGRSSPACQRCHTSRR